MIGGSLGSSSGNCNASGEEAALTFGNRDQLMFGNDEGSLMDCRFCDIASRRLSTAVVFEDMLTIAFLGKHPINPGHTLVIPKEHQENFYDLGDDSYHALMATVKRLARIVHWRLPPKKVGLIVAGWDVAHTHVHVVPMREYHDVTSKSLLEGTPANPSDDELFNTATLLRSE